MHTFGNNNEFEIRYITLNEKYKDNHTFQINQKMKECDGEMSFIVNNKNLFAIDSKCNKSLAVFTGDLFGVVEFFCHNLYFHIIDDPFPAKTKAQNSIDMMDEMKLVEGEDNDISKYANIDFDQIDMKLHEKVDVWNWRHGFVGNSPIGSRLPNIYVRKINNQQVEISWDSTTRIRRGKDEYYFMHGKGVEYIDLKLYRDTIIAFCLDAFEQLGKYFPLFIDDFKAELQKAIDVKL